MLPVFRRFKLRVQVLGDVFNHTCCSRSVVVQHPGFAENDMDMDCNAGVRGEGEHSLW